ncbi:alpha/beta fold hydrolase [Acidiphilium sp. PA]|uniref:alpha/beta hydrolase n=1 Tax=Acidiphilium sp. PA TaxID=2871705 RepID=UPI0022441E56|nr:alpha/beta fold hydrolase [Acidiphilium sp. PA]MCW8306252.1 alpha/beta fold hydrolase [Acidiphilium sp. PA]
MDDTAPATLVFLHFLGGSGDTWRSTIDHLPPSTRCVVIDLPGFGAAAAEPGGSVGAMADRVIATIGERVRGRWVLVGHSMGAKVATVIARAAENGVPALAGLSHIILLAGSPPAPEPMSDDLRAEMRGWFQGSAAAWMAQADRYIANNIGERLDPAVHRAAVADILRINRAAWVAWLDGGSREDWAARIGTLRTPALIVAGAADTDLGTDAQRALMAPHFSHHRLVTLAATGHLIPLERPAALARLIEGHAKLRREAGTIDAAYRALIASDRVSSRTRAALLARTRPQTGASVFNDRQSRTLQAVIARVIPGGGPANLAASVAASFAAPRGWRFAALPPDAEAWRLALDTLEDEADRRWNSMFTALCPARQDSMLTALAAADWDAAPGGLDAGQMRLWFEDLRSVAVRAYMAHPATFARIGYSGIAYGGDGDHKPGFHPIGLDAVESWEPAPGAPDARAGQGA